MSMLRTLYRRGIPASASALAITTGAYLYTTWDIQAIPISSPSDPIFQNRHYRRCNPNDNPTVHDWHVRKVPFSQIDPVLLENPGRLVGRYCGGLWAGVGEYSIFGKSNMLTMPGFALQRILRKFLTTPTDNQLWSPTDLLASNYHPGTTITDEFLVLQKFPNAILVRGGDTVTNQGLREMDGFIELSANVKPDEELVEFGFKSVFFQGIGKASDLPMPGFVVWLHELYAKVLLGSGVRYVLR